MGRNIPIMKDRHVVDSFSFIYTLLFSLILISGYWLVVGAIDVYVYESNRMMHVFNIIVVVLIMVMSHVYKLTDDTGQAGRPCPHLIYELMKLLEVQNFSSGED